MKAKYGNFMSVIINIIIQFQNKTIMSMFLAWSGGLQYTKLFYQEKLFFIVANFHSDDTHKYTMQLQHKYFSFDNTEMT